jgi:flagellar biosynthesis protein FlhF
MKLKSYFSGTVEAAMELARKELGEDALLIDARPASPETRGLGAFEVVFGVLAANPPAIADSPHGRSGFTGYADLRSELAEMKREIGRLAELLDGRYPSRGGAAAPPKLAEILPDEEMNGEFAGEVGGVLVELPEVDATLGRPGAVRPSVVLVGPAGSGKTTTLIKLAVRYGLAARRPVRMLSAGVHSAGGGPLRRIAGLLGIECAVAETTAALDQALAQHPSTVLLLIDTRG